MRERQTAVCKTQVYEKISTVSYYSQSKDGLHPCLTERGQGPVVRIHGSAQPAPAQPQLIRRRCLRFQSLRFDIHAALPVDQVPALINLHLFECDAEKKKKGGEKREGRKRAQPLD